MEYIESWIKCRCSKCKRINWVNQGDTTDLTGVDVEIVKCWSCGEESTCDDETEYDIGLVTKGLKKPQ